MTVCTREASGKDAGIQSEGGLPEAENQSANTQVI